MNKFLKVSLITLLALAFVLSLGGCGGKKGGVCKVTFSQEGQADIVISVNKGEGITDIPDPVQKEGYTVTWEGKNLSKVTTNVLVRAVEIPNVYKLTFDAGEGTVSVTEMEVMFDSNVTLPTASREHYVLAGWRIEGADTILTSGKYTVASDLKLVAVWSVDESDEFWSKGY